MSVRFLLPRHPSRPYARHPRLIEDLLDLVDSGRQEAVNSIIEMLDDFHRHGSASRFRQKLKGLPVWELKTQARGGQRGGARVYFFYAGSDLALLVNAESKADDRPAAGKISEVIEVLGAYRRGIPVVEEES